MCVSGGIEPGKRVPIWMLCLQATSNNADSTFIISQCVTESFYLLLRVREADWLRSPVCGRTVLLVLALHEDWKQGETASQALSQASKTHLPAPLELTDWLVLSHLFNLYKNQNVQKTSCGLCGLQLGDSNSLERLYVSSGMGTPTPQEELESVAGESASGLPLQPNPRLSVCCHDVSIHLKVPFKQSLTESWLHSFSFLLHQH